MLVTVLGGLATLAAAQDLSTSLDDRRAWLLAGEQAARLRAAYLDQEGGQRGYVITGNETFLEPYERGQAQAEALIAQLRALEGSATMPLDDVERAVVIWRTEAAQPEIDARAAGNEALADALVSAGAGKARFDVLRGELDRVDAAIETRLDDIVEDVDSGRVRTARAFLLTVLGALIVTAVAAYLVHRWLTRPLAQITSAVRRAEAGAETTIGPVGPPELRQVARAVDDMQRTISNQRDDAIRARESIEQSAILAVQVRSELTSDLGDYPSGWTMAAGLRAAEGIVAGDCYDVALVSPTTIGIVVLDIAGHGVQSAIAALKCKELLKAALRSGLEPGASIGWLSEQDHGLGDLFLTAFVAQIDTDSGRGTYANAGHPHALLAGGGVLERLGPTGPIVGPIPGGWDSGSMVINPGGKLIIYTDGLTEARDVQREFYGEERLVRLLATLECPDAQPVIDEILADLDVFHPGRLADDVTLVVACRTSPTPEIEADDDTSSGARSEERGTEGTGVPAGSPDVEPRMDDDVRVAEQAVP